MLNARVLLMHFSKVTGHRWASLAIEQALKEIQAPDIQTKNIDSLGYLNPYVGKTIFKFYVFVVKRLPIIWDYLYDNQRVFRGITKLRLLIYKLTDKKIKRLLQDFRPDIIVCTQAYPCGLLADYKRRHNLTTPLIGVLTDYACHSYWLADSVDFYLVPAEKIKQRLTQKGIPIERIKVVGIPIDNKFRQLARTKETLHQFGLDPNLPIILIMGGVQGIGPIKKIVRALDQLNRPVQLLVVCGTNKQLYYWLKRQSSLFTNPIHVLGLTEQVHRLMDVSSFIVTKPGGLTSAEALSKSLPIIIFKPLPGQESQNTQFLLEAKVALKADNFLQLKTLAEELLTNPQMINQLRQNQDRLAYADSAIKIAQFILDIAKQHHLN